MDYLQDRGVLNVPVIQELLYQRYKMTKRKAEVSDGEYVILAMTIEKVFDGSAMDYTVVEQSENLSEKFKKVLREDWDIDVDEYTALVAIEETVIDLDEERILFDT